MNLISVLASPLPVEGYPIFVFYTVALLGAVLIACRPFYAVLFGVFGIAAKNFHAAILTRTEYTGAFLNLGDLFLWIAFAGMFREALKLRRMYFPMVIVAILVVLSIAVFQSFYKYGLDSYIMRSVWYVAVFPLSFLLAANTINSEHRARLLLWALFMGALAATMQHMFFLMVSMFEGVRNPATLRTISYLGSGAGFLLVLSLVSTVNISRKAFTYIYYPALVLFFISILMHQTRQVYVVLALTIITLPLFLGRVVGWRKLLVKLCVLVLLGIISFRVLYPDLDFEEIVGQRMATLTTEESVSQSYSSRWLGLNSEFQIWMESPLIIGTGVAYPPELTEANRQGDGAQYFAEIGGLDHVAASSYLAHYGVLGLFVYLFLLPGATVLSARRYIYSGVGDYESKIAMLAVIVAFADLYGAFGSALNTSVGAHVPGLIYGAYWGLVKVKRTSPQVV